MNDIRAKFEEIWPVPEGVSWNEACGMYSPSIPGKFNEYYGISCEHDARLDTFTRCQESMGPVLSLVEEMVAEIDRLAEDAYGCTPQPTQDIVDRANKFIGSNK